MYTVRLKLELSQSEERFMAKIRISEKFTGKTAFREPHT